MPPRRRSLAILLAPTLIGGCSSVDSELEAKVPATSARYFEGPAGSQIRFGDYAVVGLTMVHGTSLDQKTSDSTERHRSLAFELVRYDGSEVVEQLWEFCSVSGSRGTFTHHFYFFGRQSVPSESRYARLDCMAYSPNDPDVQPWRLTVTGSDDIDITEASWIGGLAIRPGAKDPEIAETGAIVVKGGGGIWNFGFVPPERTVKGIEDHFLHGSGEKHPVLAGIDISGDDAQIRIDPSLPVARKTEAALIMGALLAVDAAPETPPPTLSNTANAQLGRAAQISVAGSHVCVLNQDGSVVCSSDGKKYDPGARGVERVFAGHGFACASRKDAPTVCWGEPGSGSAMPALGDGAIALAKGDSDTQLNWKEPANVFGVREVSAFVGSRIDARHACALLKSGEVFCWGDTLEWVVPTSGDRTAIETPVAIPEAKGASKLVLYEADSHCSALAALFPDGSARVVRPSRLPECHDAMFRFPLTRLSTPLTETSDLAFGRYYGVAAYRDGSVRIWGETGTSSATRVETESAADEMTPRKVFGLEGIVAVAASGDAACALDRAGTLYCWGAGLPRDAVAAAKSAAAKSAAAKSKPLVLDGWDSSDDSTMTRPIPVLEHVRSVELAERAGCALLEDGSVKCWGPDKRSVWE
ncbi:MAG: hypothetical protein U0271_00070 [Polyangiaceae bacterium]